MRSVNDSDRGNERRSIAGPMEDNEPKRSEENEKKKSKLIVLKKDIANDLDLNFEGYNEQPLDFSPNKKKNR